MQYGQKYEDHYLSDCWRTVGIPQFQSSIDMASLCMINRCAMTVRKSAALLQRIAPKRENKLKSIRRSREWRASGVTRVYVVPFWSRHSSDGIVTRLRIEDGGTTVRFPAKTRLFLSSETPRPALGTHPASYSRCTRSLSAIYCRR